MKKINLLLLLLVMSISSIHAQSPPIPSPLQVGAYIPGLINPRDYSNPGTSGLIGMDYNVFFNTGQYYDRNGDKVDKIDLGLGHGPVPIDIDISGYLNALVVAYVSPELSFLGNSRYLAFLAPLYSTADFRVSISELVDSTLQLNGSTGGFGDMGFAPLYLTWSLGEDKFDITTGYMFTAPTGRYATGADDNIGLGYWNHSFQLFTYYYLMQKATALYLANTFEFHSKIKDVDVRPGSRYTIEYGISQYLSERFEITVQGGQTWQVGKDSGDDVYWNSTFKDRNSTIGAGLGFWFVKEKFYTNLKWWTNYGMRQHFKVNNFQVQLLYIPDVLKSARDKEIDY